jgi:hypothetical protein
MICPKCGYDTYVPQNSMIDRYCPNCSNKLIDGQDKYETARVENQIRAIETNIAEKVVQKENDKLKNKNDAEYAQIVLTGLTLMNSRGYFPPGVEEKIRAIGEEIGSNGGLDRMIKIYYLVEHMGYEFEGNKISHRLAHLQLIWDRVHGWKW